MSAALKFVAPALDYRFFKGNSVERIDTNSLKAGGDNEMLPAGYRDRDIKNGQNGKRNLQGV